MKHAVVSQSKHILSGHPQKGMIVVVALCASLGGHPGVSQNDPGLFRHPEAQAVGRNWALVDPQRPAHIVGNAGSVGPSYLTGRGQYSEHTVLFAPRQSLAIINQSKQTAHFRSPPLPKPHHLHRAAAPSGTG